MDEINPEQVPQYPLYVIALDEVTGTATLDGVPMEPAQGVNIAKPPQRPQPRKPRQTPRRCTSVIRSTQGEEWTMIIAVDGSDHRHHPRP